MADRKEDAGNQEERHMDSPEPQSQDSDGIPSHIPRSWRVLHILLCFVGINNVFFIKSMPWSLRLASLIYHTTWLCLSVPLIFLTIYNALWGASITSVLERVSGIIFSSFILTLGIVYLINAVKENRATQFLRKWYLFHSSQLKCDVDVKTKYYIRVRAVLIIITISHFIFSLIMIVASSLIMHWSAACESDMFPTYRPSNFLLGTVCVVHTLISISSGISVSLTICYIAFIAITLAEQFGKLHGIICNLSSPPCGDIDAWEQVRFRHDALVSLVCLHGQLSTMLLGLILVGYVGFLCSNLYYVIVVEAGVFGIINVTISISILLAIIAPSYILENEMERLDEPLRRMPFRGLSAEILYEVDALRRNVKQQKAPITACGLVTIRRSTILAVVSVLVTYLIVAIQFHQSDVGGRNATWFQSGIEDKLFQCSKCTDLVGNVG